LPDSHRYKNTINDSEPTPDAVATGETVGNATAATAATSATTATSATAATSAATSEATVGTAGDDCGSKKLASCLIGEVMAYRDFGDPAA
jgi:hypothetical protein